MGYFEIYRMKDIYKFTWIVGAGLFIALGIIDLSINPPTPGIIGFWIGFLWGSVAIFINR